jgi:hypothetical protein
MVIFCLIPFYKSAFGGESGSTVFSIARLPWGDVEELSSNVYVIDS